jgi:excisionase family DNA binding protein
MNNPTLPANSGAAPDVAPLLLTPNQVATRLQVSTAWVRDHATRKLPKIPSIKVGKLLRFHEADVNQFIRAQSDWMLGEQPSSRSVRQ